MSEHVTDDLHILRTQPGLGFSPNGFVFWMWRVVLRRDEGLCWNWWPKIRGVTMPCYITRACDLYIPDRRSN